MQILDPDSDTDTDTEGLLLSMARRNGRASLGCTGIGREFRQCLIKTCIKTLFFNVGSYGIFLDTAINDSLNEMVWNILRAF